MQGVSSTSQLCNSHSLPKPVKSLNLCFNNVRSLLPKIDEFRSTCLSLDSDIFGVTETWLSEEILDGELYVPAWLFPVTTRSYNRHGGGIALYVRCSLNCEVILFLQMI